MEARAARVRAERVERAGRGGRDFIHSPGADKGVVSPRGVGSTADEKRRSRGWTRKSAVGPSDGTRSSARSTRRGGDCASCS